MGVKGAVHVKFLHVHISKTYHVFRENRLVSVDFDPFGIGPNPETRLVIIDLETRFKMVNC